MFVEPLLNGIGAGAAAAVSEKIKAAMNDADAAVSAQRRSTMTVEELELEAMQLGGEVRMAEDMAKSWMPWLVGCGSGALLVGTVLCSILRGK